MKRIDFGAVFGAIIFIILFGCLAYCLFGSLYKSPDKLIKEDSEYLYIREYILYNKDSCVYKYHKPIEHEGIVTNKYSYIRGVPGKGGHRVYKTTFKFNGKEISKEDWSLYNKVKDNQKVKISEKFYPVHSYYIDVNGKSYRIY